MSKEIAILKLQTDRRTSVFGNWQPLYDKLVRDLKRAFGALEVQLFHNAGGLKQRLKYYDYDTTIIIPQDVTDNLASMDSVERCISKFTEIVNAGKIIVVLFNEKQIKKAKKKLNKSLLDNIKIYKLKDLDTIIQSIKERNNE